MPPVLTDEEIQKRFMQIFQFDEEDLTANRKEEMSVKQKRLMRNYAIIGISIFEFMGIMSFALTFFSSEKHRPLPIMFPIIFFLFCTLIGGALFWMYWSRYKEGTVIWLNGPVEIKKKEGRTFLCIDEFTILVGANVNGLFKEHEIYNVYYVDWVNHIVSVEKAA